MYWPPGAVAPEGSVQKAPRGDWLSAAAPQSLALVAWAYGTLRPGGPRGRDPFLGRMIITIVFMNLDPRGYLFSKQTPRPTPDKSGDGRMIPEPKKESVHFYFLTINARVRYPSGPPPLYYALSGTMPPPLAPGRQIYEPRAGPSPAALPDGLGFESFMQ